MRQSEIETQIWHQIEPLRAMGNVDVFFGPMAKPEEEVDWFHTEGTVPLTFWVDEEGGNFTVRVTEVGNSQAIAELDQRACKTDCVIPQGVFVQGDSFKDEFYDNAPSSSRHYGVYVEVCKALQPKSVMEIGVRGGYSAWAMLSAGTITEYVGLDKDDGDSGGSLGYMDRARIMLADEFPDVSIHIEKVDTQLSISLPRKFDLISIDGGHNHDQVLHDLELCAPFADYLLVDDTNFISTVHSGVCEFLENHPEFTAWRYDTWRGFVLIETKGGKAPARHFPEIFERPNIEEAKGIILTPEAGLTTQQRWEAETNWIMSKVIYPEGLLFDIGCGVGRLSRPLCLRRNNRIIGVDASPQMRKLAPDYVGNPGRFTIVSPEMFSQLVGFGLRGQGAIAVWALQHFPEDDLMRQIQTLWQALEPGALLYTLDRPERYVPVDMAGHFGWHQDGVDVPRILDREGFRIIMEEEPPPTVCAPGAVLRQWIRRR